MTIIAIMNLVTAFTAFCTELLFKSTHLCPVRWSLSIPIVLINVTGTCILCVKGKKGDSMESVLSSGRPFVYKTPGLKNQLFFPEIWRCVWMFERQPILNVFSGNFCNIFVPNGLTPSNNRTLVQTVYLSVGFGLLFRFFDRVCYYGVLLFRKHGDRRTVQKRRREPLAAVVFALRVCSPSILSLFQSSK